MSWKDEDVTVVVPVRNEPPVASVNMDGLPKNGRSWAVWTVQSILKDLPGAQVVVVDDASDPEYVKMYEAMPDGVTVMRNDKNIGVGASRNRGISYGSGELLLVADAHVWSMRDGAFRNLVTHAAESEVFAVCQVHTHIRKSPKHGAHFLFMRDKYLGWQYGPMQLAEAYPIDVPNGGAYAFQRSVYDHLQLWPTTSGTFGHNPVTKGLMCYFTDTPAMLFKDAPIVHRYGGVGYSYEVDSQWKNACRAYAIIFHPSTYFQYWKPILSRVLGDEYVDEMWNVPSVVVARECFAEKKRHTDAEFFRTKLHAPCCTHTDNSVMFVPKVAIVIPCWNETPAEVEETFDSIRKHSDFDHISVVVDDASDEPVKLPKYTFQAADGKVGSDLAEFTANNPPEKSKGRSVAGNRQGAIVVRNPQRSGVAHSRNVGLGIARKLDCDVAILADMGVRFDPGVVLHMSEEAMRVAPEKGIVAASFANWTHDPADAVRKVYGANLVLRKTRGLGASYRREEPQEPVSMVPHIIGSVYAATMKTWWEEFGGFYALPGGMWGCAEALLTLRSFFWNLPLFVDKRAFVRHMLHEGRTVPQQGYLARVHMLHLLAFSDKTYEQIFQPRLLDLGVVMWTDDQTAYVRAARATFQKKAVRTERQFFEAYLPELLDEFDAIHGGKEDG
jgi:glycosyltransferase involved in cell wall biosynthesis